MSSFFVHNFGCRANQADGVALTADLERSGWARATAAAEADCVVFNTCTVTAAADAEAQRAIRRLRRERPQAKIVVTGCYAQRAPRALTAIAGVSLVVGNTHKHTLAALLTGGVAEARAGELPKIVTGDIFERLPLLAAPVPPLAAGGEKTRPTVKVQEGCGYRCSYCVIPFVRGASRSLPLGAVLERIQSLVAAGCQEAVISGVNLGEWGKDLDGGPGAIRLRLPDLVRAILEQTTLPRLRLSSVEPADWSGDWSDALTDFMAASDVPRLARHVHLPLQSGSDAVLRRMRRRYRAAHYAQKIERLRRRVPLAAIGADVMVGFPGETEAEFEETRAFIAAMPFTYLHVFSFSRRDGTEAARQIEATGAWRPVPEAVAAERGHVLRRLIAAKRADFLATLIGAHLDVVTLAEPRATGCWGLSDNFVKVAVDEVSPPNRMLAVEVAGVREDYLEGRGIGL